MVRTMLVISALFQASYAYAVDNLGIIGGHNVTIHDIPFIVSLHEITNGTTTITDDMVCSGSIIHERFILTSASCVRANVTRKIRGGSDKWSEDGSFIDVEKKICHEFYDDVTYTNDICLLKLKNPISFDWLVLPNLPEDGYKVEESTLANVTGWGATQNAKFFNMKRSATLHQVSIPIVYKSKCNYGGQQLKGSQICAGARDHDICLGDSGSPLTLNGTLIGIVSHGAPNVRCGDKPSVYTGVSSYVNWIDVTIQDNL